MGCKAHAATKSNQSTIKRSSSIMFRGYIKFKRKASIIFKHKSVRRQARLPKALTVRNHLYYLALRFSWCWYSFDIWGMYLPGVFIRAYVRACGWKGSLKCRRIIIFICSRLQLGLDIFKIRRRLGSGMNDQAREGREEKLSSCMAYCISFFDWFERKNGLLCQLVQKIDLFS